MKKVGIVYDPIYIKHRTTPGHPENNDRIISTIEFLKKQKIYNPNQKNEQFININARDALVEELLWCHTPALIARVQKSAEQAVNISRNVQLDGDTSVSGDSYNAALKAVGGNFAAIDAIFNGTVDRAMVLCRPPGHHANSNASRGFCLFNNIALGCHYLFRKKNLNRVAIIDFDVHAGNGTEDIFWDGTGMDGKELLMISSHQNPSYFYPGTGFINELGGNLNKGRIVNIPLERYAGDQCYQIVMDELILPLLDEFKPEFIYISAGFDGHFSDPIGGLGFTSQGFGNIIKNLNPISEKYASGRMAVTLEGGYNLDALSRSIVNVISCLSDDSIIFKEDHDDPKNIIEFTENRLVPKVKETLSSYWNCFTS